MRLRISALLTVAAASSIGPGAAQMNAGDDVMTRVRAMYAALHSYSDTGAVFKQYAAIQERHTFTTCYKAPRLFHFDFQKDGGDRFVIWSDEKLFHSWWKSTGAQEDYPRGQGMNAFLPAEFITADSGLKIPALLFSGSGLQGAFANFAQPTPDGTEEIGGRKCYRLVGTAKDVYAGTGREVNVRQMTVWVDTESLLIRQVVEESPKGTPAATTVRTTTTFEPQANPSLQDSRFQFVAPTAK